jgi:uncharacterized RDD family membrane protein YckC
MRQSSVPLPVAPEEREPAAFWSADLEPWTTAEDYYRAPPVTAPPGYASWLARVLAALLDTALVALPLALLGRGLLGVAIVVSVALGVYDVVVRQGRTGRTWGKSLMRLRVVDEANAEPIGCSMTAIRALAHLVDAIPFFIGFLWPLWDRRRQTFADKLLGTVVLA